MRTDVSPFPGILRAILVAAMVPVFALGCKTEVEDAESRFQRASRGASPTVPKEARTWLIRANDALRSGSYQQALSLVDSATAIQPGLADARFIRARALEELNRPQQALEAYRKVIEEAPDYQGARWNMGNIAFRRGDYRKALRWYRAEQERYPAAKVSIHLGRTHRALGNRDSARNAFQEVLTSGGGERGSAPEVRADAHYRLARLHREERQIEEARGHAQKAVELAPDDPEYRYTYAAILRAAGRTDAASEQLSAVLRQDSTHEGAHRMLGQLYRRQGDSVRAELHLATADTLDKLDGKIERLRSRAEKNSNNPVHWIELGKALQRAGRIDQAMEAYRVVLSMTPSNVAVQTILARLALQAGDPTESIQRYQKILQERPSFTEGWINIGLAFASVGEDSLARDAWRKALEQDSTNQRAKRYLARLDS